MDYDPALDLTARTLGECLPPDRVAHCVVDSVALLDLTALYARYGSRGGAPYAPEVLLGLLPYGYATGVFSSRKIERATYEAIPFRFIAGNLHPTVRRWPRFRIPACSTQRAVRAGAAAGPGSGRAHAEADQPGSEREPR